MDAKKYPNVFLTQGLVDLSQYDQTNNLEKITNRKLKVISQILDEPQELDIIDNNIPPVGLERDPWESEDKDLPPRINEQDLPPEVIEYMKSKGLTIADLLDEDYDPYEADNRDDYRGPFTNKIDSGGSWQEDLKNWFTNN